MLRTCYTCRLAYIRNTYVYTNHILQTHIKHLTIHFKREEKMNTQKNAYFFLLSLLNRSSTHSAHKPSDCTCIFCCYFFGVSFDSEYKWKAFTFDNIKTMNSPAKKIHTHTHAEIMTNFIFSSSNGRMRRE